MDLIKKMTTAIEAAVTQNTELKALDFSLALASNEREDIANGFSVTPTFLNQTEGAVGFIRFTQGFRVSLFLKYYKTDAQEKVFELYQKLENTLKALYAIRVTGENYQVVNINALEVGEPVVKHTFVQLDCEFSVLYTRTKVF